MNDFEGKVAVITGASRGIGAAVARSLHSRGASVGLASRSGDDLGLERVVARPTDVRDRAQVQALVDATAERFGGIDIVVANAGVGAYGPFVELRPDHLDEMIDTNVKGVLHVNRAIVPLLVARGRGTVIHLGSIAGRQVYPGGNVYCAAKHAVRALNEGLRLDLLGTGVRVATVDPGMVGETEFSLVRFRGDADRASAVYRGMTPLRPEDVAELVVFVATRPRHVNIAETVILPTDQASATNVHRRSGAQ